MQNLNEVKSFCEKFENRVEGVSPIMAYILFLEMSLHFTSSEDYQGYTRKESFDLFVHQMRLTLKQKAFEEMKEMKLQ